MDSQLDSLQVGEMVVCDEYAVDTGVVIEELGEYVQVLWDSLSVPTTHRRTSLKKSLRAARSWH